MLKTTFQNCNFETILRFVESWFLSNSSIVNRTHDNDWVCSTGTAQLRFAPQTYSAAPRSAKHEKRVQRSHIGFQNAFIVPPGVGYGTENARNTYVQVSQAFQNIFRTHSQKRRRVFLGPEGNFAYSSSPACQSEASLIERRCNFERTLAFPHHTEGETKISRSRISISPGHQSQHVQSSTRTI